MTRKHGVLGAIVVVAALAATPVARADTGPVGNWHFDEGSGGQAADSSGNANTGFLADGPQWVAGHQNGYALAFNGSGARVTVPRSASLEAPAVTVSAWVKRAGSPGAYKYLVAKGAAGCLAASYGIYTGPTGGLMFYVAGNDFTYQRSADAGTGVWDGAWHHVAGTYDGSSVRLYIDGAPVGSANSYTGPLGYGFVGITDLSVASYRGCGGLDFDGTIDELRIWGRALSADEVHAVAFYDFHGFFSPVNNQPTLNVAKAGSAIPVKFSLTGDYGLGIFSSAPTSRRVTCDSGAPSDAIEQTVTSVGGGLQYDAATDQYTYVWKTDKAFAGTCRELDVRLDDGSTHSAEFQFK